VFAVSGYFRPELATDRSQICFTVLVGSDVWSAAYDRSQATIRNFNLTRLVQGQTYYLSYFLTEQDCITFAQDVARIVGLTTPPRGLQRPVTYVRTLYEANRR
jgi:hypothetical protein